MHGDDFDTFIKNFPTKITERGDMQLRWFYVLSFYLIWSFIIEGIVQGIIVDAFAEIRARDDAQKADTREHCLVCSVDRFTLEQKGGGFFRHIVEDHDPWQYLHFLVDLAETSINAETGLQTFVANEIESDRLEFTPQGTCYAMQAAVEHEEQEADTHDEYSAILQRLDQFEHSMNRRMDEFEERQGRRAGGGVFVDFNLTGGGA